jgi:hypothetical protein
MAYQVTMELHAAVISFIERVKLVDQDVIVETQLTDRDVCIKIVSHKFRQESLYAVWQNTKTKEITGSLLQVIHF